MYQNRIPCKIRSIYPIVFIDVICFITGKRPIKGSKRIQECGFGDTGHIKEEVCLFGDHGRYDLGAMTLA